MALIKCPECKKKISNQCESCPHCGFPVKQNNITKNVSENICEFNTNENTDINRKIQKSSKKKINRKFLFSIFIIFIVGIVICVTTTIFSEWRNKQNSYDLSTVPSGYISTDDPYTLYVNTTEKNISVSTSVYLSNNMYIQAASTFSSLVHTPNDVFYVYDYGVFEENEDSLIFLNSESEIKEYKVLNQYLLCYDDFYYGEIPKKDLFNSTLKRTFDDGTEQTVTFFDDGTFLFNNQGNVTKEGTYTRDGYNIRCTSTNIEDDVIEFVVYDGKLTQSYYKCRPLEKDVDWIEYKSLIYKRDELQMSLSTSERFRVRTYETEHPISK